jgi:L-threonylcarbamoyladenylate synthase
MTPEDVAAFESCIAGGGVALFPADTVYGLAAHPDDEAAIARLYRLKGRDEGKPAAVMFFDLDRALAALSAVPPRTREALRRLLPGAVTAVLPGGAGLRVPRLEGPLAPLSKMGFPVLQSSANPAGDPAPRRLADVDPALRAGVDLELDGGALPGTASTVVDLSGYEDGGAFEVLREGAVPAAVLRDLL